MDEDWKLAITGCVVVGGVGSYVIYKMTQTFYRNRTVNALLDMDEELVV
jgi:hypothetical protein